MVTYTTSETHGLPEGLFHGVQPMDPKQHPVHRYRCSVLRRCPGVGFLVELLRCVFRDVCRGRTNWSRQVRHVINLSAGPAALQNAFIPIAPKSHYISCILLLGIQVDLSRSCGSRHKVPCVVREQLNGFGTAPLTYLGQSAASKPQFCRLLAHSPYIPLYHCPL